jgi:hypothetical protein
MLRNQAMRLVARCQVMQSVLVSLITVKNTMQREVSMPSQTPSLPVGADLARNLAWQNTKRLLITGEAGRAMPALADWHIDNVLPEGADPSTMFEGSRAGRRSGAINPLPEDGIKIFDVRGRPLFYEFALTLLNGKQLRAHPAADQLLGVPVLNTSIGDPLPITTMATRAEQVARDNGLTVLPGPERLTCYSYPKLGLLCTDREGVRKVIDIAEHTVIPVSDSREIEISDRSDLLTTWSPLDVPAGPTQADVMRDFQARSEMLNDVEGDAAEDQSGHRVLPEMVLFGQKTPVFCAVASAQMILNFLGVEKEQDEIAQIMQTGPAGSTTPNQVAAYGTLSGNRFKGILQQPPTFEQLQNEINAHRPVKSGVIGHARVAAGWRITQVEGMPPLQEIFVFDPWPVPSPAAGVNGGHIYWEPWLPKPPHTNFITVEQQPPLVG